MICGPAFTSASTPRARIASPRTPASWLSADANKAGTASLADRATKTRMIFRWVAADGRFRAGNQGCIDSRAAKSRKALFHLL